MKKMTQKQAIFYKLLKERERNPIDYIPLWQLQGEIYCEELDVWGFVSYEIPARMSELFADNDGMFERVMVEGKSGARYYAYRLAEDYKSKMCDSKLQVIHDAVHNDIVSI